MALDGLCPLVTSSSRLSVALLPGRRKRQFSALHLQIPQRLAEADPEYDGPSAIPANMGIGQVRVDAGHLARFSF